MEARIAKLERLNRWLWLALVVSFTSPWLKEFSVNEAVGVEEKAGVIDVLKCRELQLVDGADVLGGLRLVADQGRANSETAQLWFQKNGREKVRFGLDWYGRPTLKMDAKDVAKDSTTEITSSGFRGYEFLKNGPQYTK